MILVATHHAASPPAHHETSKHDSPNDTRIRVKQLKCPGFEFKPHQVNNLSQSNQVTDHLVSQNESIRRDEEPTQYVTSYYVHIQSLPIVVHKQNYLLLTTLISGPKEAGKDIDVF
jgi:hypothetical protein